MKDLEARVSNLETRVALLLKRVNNEINKNK